MLHITKEEVDKLEKRGKLLLTVVGCEQIAMSYAIAFAETGFKVTCTGADQSFIKKVSKGNIQIGSRQAESKLRSFLRSESISATSDYKNAVSKSNILIITAGAKLDAQKNIDRTELESTCKKVGSALQKGSLVVYAGIAGVGSTDNLVKEILENTSGLKVGEDFALAYNPPPSSDIQKTRQLGEDELKVAANDKFSLNSAALIFETVAKKGVKSIPSTKAAELAMLFASAKRDVDVALANELAAFCENAKVDYGDIMKLLESDAFQSFSRPTIAADKNREEVYLLLESAENLNAKLRLSLLARQVNEEMMKHALNLTQEALRSSGKTLRRARVALLAGMESGATSLAFVELLEAKGAKVTRYDPYCGVTGSVEEGSSVKKTLNETVEAADCVVILSDQDSFGRLSFKKLRAVMKSPAALVDLAGVVEPSKVVAEGFIYRGIGRGDWEK